MYPLRPRRINAECGGRQRTRLPGRPCPVPPIDGPGPLRSALRRANRKARERQSGTERPSPWNRSGSTPANLCNSVVNPRKTTSILHFRPNVVLVWWTGFPSLPNPCPRAGRRMAGHRQPAPHGRSLRHGGAVGPDGDPDPTNAGTAGDAALWGGSSAAVGMAANPCGARQAGRHRAGREGGRHAAALVAREEVRIPHRAGVCREHRCPAAPATPRRSRR